MTNHIKTIIYLFFTIWKQMTWNTKQNSVLLSWPQWWLNRKQKVIRKSRVWWVKARKTLHFVKVSVKFQSRKNTTKRSKSGLFGLQDDKTQQVTVTAFCHRFLQQFIRFTGRQNTVNAITAFCQIFHVCDATHARWQRTVFQLLGLLMTLFIYIFTSDLYNHLFLLA